MKNARLILQAVALVYGIAGHAGSLAWAQDSPAPPSSSLPPALPAAAPGAAPTNAELLDELQRLRAEVQEARQLRGELEQLRGEIGYLRAVQPVVGLDAGGVSSDPLFNGVPDRHASGAFVADQGLNAENGRFAIKGRYKYNDKATGPLGGGGYFSFSDFDDEFSLNITNQITADGTFVDRANLPTTEQGFNIPFARTYFYGNITKDWSYQIGTQGFLGTFNLLDSWMSWHLPYNVTLRAGKGLAPPLYEYYAFTPALEPVITNSPLFQLAAKRPIGIMFSGTALDSRVQWWSGVNNSAASLFGNLDRNVDYNGAIDITPFRGGDWEGSIFEGLGGGVGVSAGQQHYNLHQSNISLTNNGEATTNPAFVTVLGLPFFTFNQNVWADGMRTRVAPHIYWYGRFSILAEMINHSRELTDGANTARSTQIAYYVNASYWLTGERDFMGNGFQGYSTTQPLRPFSFSKHQFGPGAWQIASQWSEFNAGSADIRNGFVAPTGNATRMDNFMIGMNWWPNKYTRLSFDYVWTWFNNPITLVPPNPISEYNTLWFRFAMFF